MTLVLAGPTMSAAALSVRCTRPLGWRPTRGRGGVGGVGGGGGGGGGGGRRRSGCRLRELRRVSLLETVDEPACRRPRRTVGPIDGPHRDHVTPGRRILGRDLNQRAARQVRLDHMQWQGTEPEACPQESKFGPQVGQAPDSRELYAGSVASRDIGGIDV